MIDYRGSIKNLLKNISQEQVDVWTETHNEEKTSIEDFITNFIKVKDFSKEGLVSLLAVCSMAPAKNDAESIEKSGDEKILLYCKLAERRMKKEGLGDEEIKNQIFENVSNAYDIDGLLEEEMGQKYGK
jgi:hypothetical protein